MELVGDTGMLYSLKMEIAIRLVTGVDGMVAQMAGIKKDATDRSIDLSVVLY